MSNRLSVQKAAELMGANEQFVRIGLRDGLLPFGVALKRSPRSSRWVYYISVPKFEEYTGIKVTQP